MLVEDKSSVESDKLVRDENTDLNSFLEEWDRRYMLALKKIPLFSENNFLDDLEKIKHFVSSFYHIRGKFHNFLWYMGNISPNKYIKKIIVENIYEEFGGGKKSHEQLYHQFSLALGIDTTKEFLSQEIDDYIVKFNQGHLEWLSSHNWYGCIAAFSAYERLDNVDYKCLSALVSTLGLKKIDTLFFSVHEKVEHFQPFLDELSNIWDKSKREVVMGFDFIAIHQLTMWKELSERIQNVVRNI